MSGFMSIANTINECLHAYGIHSSTLQPELNAPHASASGPDTSNTLGKIRDGDEVSTRESCMIGCQTANCEHRSCCN